MNTLKKIFQVILGLISFLIGVGYIFWRLPGNFIFCDPDQIFIFQIGLIFSVSFLWFLILVSRTEDYRDTIFIISFCFLGSMFLTSPILKFINYGIVNQNYVHDEMALIYMKLYKNGKFISSTYDGGCQIENTGTYEINNKEMILSFNDEKSEYLGTRYTLNNSFLECSNCTYQLNLRIEKD